jgi:tetratricopeptide (TPR) repeat protein
MRPRTSLATGIAVVLSFTAVLGHPGIFHDLERVSASIVKEPRNAELYVERAYYYRLNDQFPEALADCDRAHALDPRDTHVAAERGLTLSAMRRDHEAEAELTRFIRAGGRNDQIFAERAKVRERAGRHVQAVADYKAALELKPDVELYLACGALQESMGDMKGAAATYHDALAHVGSAVTLHLALIRVETARKDYSAALDLIDQELARTPVKTEWYLQKGDVLHAAGREKQARAVREQALAEANSVLAQNPSGIHLFSRAKVQIALGNQGEARRDLEKTLEQSPRFQEASELLARLPRVEAAKGMKP